MIEQQSLTGALLASEIVALARNDAERAAMSSAARRMAQPDAAKVIVDRVIELAR
jgi:UDP-N-acetylglucosamine:LPS N-acetylglucosamine transferase